MTDDTRVRRNIFERGEYRPDRGWTFIDNNGFLPVGCLIGATVNIGTKDGEVFDTVTVTAVEGMGVLILEGGKHGWRFGNRETEDNTTSPVSIYDIARGFVHDEAATAGEETR